MKEILLNLVDFVRNLGTSIIGATKALNEESRLLKLLQIAKPKICDYTNYKHYIANKEKVKEKTHCSFRRQKNYTKLQRRRRSVLKTTTKNV